MNQVIVSIIVAKSTNNVIGIKNQLPWHLSDDLKHFKKITLNHSIIMGRKTYESIGRPLPQRTNIIITRNLNYQAAGCMIVHSLQKAIELALSKNEKEIFIIGGGELFKEALPLATKIYLTEVDVELDGDAFFPSIDFSKWKEVKRVNIEKDENNQYDFSIIELIKI